MLLFLLLLFLPFSPERVVVCSKYCLFALTKNDPQALVQGSSTRPNHGLAGQAKPTANPDILQSALQGYPRASPILLFVGHAAVVAVLVQGIEDLRTQLLQLVELVQAQVVRLAPRSLVGDSPFLLTGTPATWPTPERTGAFRDALLRCLPTVPQQIVSNNQSTPRPFASGMRREQGRTDEQENTRFASNNLANTRT